MGKESVNGDWLQVCPWMNRAAISRLKNLITQFIDRQPTFMFLPGVSSLPERCPLFPSLKKRKGGTKIVVYDSRRLLSRELKFVKLRGSGVGAHDGTLRAFVSFMPARMRSSNRYSSLERVCFTSRPRLKVEVRSRRQIYSNVFGQRWALGVTVGGVDVSGCFPRACA